MAIVGLGPKGLFALERLMHRAQNLPGERQIAIDVYEPHPVPGAGPNYDPSQPDFLRMNFADDQIDMWHPAGSVVPGEERRGFARWRVARGATAAGRYAARAEVGLYLADGRDRLLAHTPVAMTVNIHAREAHTIESDGPRWRVKADGQARTYDEVLVTTGHEPSSAAPLAAGWQHRARLVPAVFPVADRLSVAAVPAGASVAVRGFALTFLDAALALTEGRGGRFEDIGHPYRVRYVASEDAITAIVPFARRGRPMLAKPLPGVAASIEGLNDVAQRAREQILALPAAGDPLDGLLAIVAATIASTIGAATSQGSLERASLQRAVEKDLHGTADGAPVTVTVTAASEIEQSLAVGADLAPPDLPWATGHVWRSIYPAIVARFGGDGLPAERWPAFRRVAAEMERVAFGPPPDNAAKLLALIRHGVVDTSFAAGGRIAAGASGSTELETAGHCLSVDVVVDAVLAPPGAPTAGHSVWLELLAGGHARLGAGRRGIDVDRGGGCRGRDGRVSTGLSAIGRVTEDVVIGNDTLSRTLHPIADEWARRVALRAGHVTPLRRAEAIA